MMPWSLARRQGPCCWGRPRNVPHLLSSFIVLEGAMETAGGNNACSATLYGIQWKCQRKMCPLVCVCVPFSTCVWATSEIYPQPRREGRGIFERATGFSSLLEMEGNVRIHVTSSRAQGTIQK